MKRLPRRLRWGLGGLAAMLIACTVGPLLLPAFPPADPVRCALLPPGTQVTTLQLTDGRFVSATSISELGETLILGRGATAVRVAVDSVQRRGVTRHLLGTDRFGRDVTTELLRGGRISLAIAALAAIVALGLGLVVGLAAATAGPLVDNILMRTVDAALAFPMLFLMILVAATFRPGPTALILLLGSTTWMSLSRLVRGEVLSLRRRPFILAARAAGSRWSFVWTRHYLPNVAAPVAQDTALRMGDLVIAEATLSYLGLGIPPTIPTWGSMVAEGHRVMLDGWWLATVPGIAIAALVICLALVGDGLQQLLAENG